MFTSSPVHQFSSQRVLCTSRAFIGRQAKRIATIARQIAFSSCVFLGLSQFGHAEVMRGASLLCGDEKLAPVYVFTRPDAVGLFRLNAMTTEKNTYRFSYEAVAETEIVGLCGLGFSVASTPVPKLLAAIGSDGQKSIGAISTLPSSFSIVGTYYGAVFGNFWVQTTMPRGQNTQWSAFDVIPTNFEAPNNSAHLVHSLLTYSEDNIETSFSGKGIIFGQWGPSFGCGTVGRTFAPAVEIWGNGAGGTVLSPSTCGPDMTPGTSYGFTTSANMAQQMTYSQYFSGASTPIFSTPVFYATGPNFVTGYSGVAFFVSTDGRLPANGAWSLQFSGVSSGTF